ncbi:MAG: hypothetical protein MJY82_10200 [Fibrobacter sp.]|nr:hypothetical protein [Fibrobacter sp.]
MEKKIYKAPKMSVVQMKLDCAILADSGEFDPNDEDVDNYPGEMGFNFNPSEHNRQA